jgi:hypothetical protein
LTPAFAEIAAARAGLSDAMARMDAGLERAEATIAAIRVREPAQPASASSRHDAACQECGQGFARGRAEARFCRPECRAAFNNRRKERGAILYDLFMAHRHERPLAVALKALRAMNRLAAEWRSEDLARRAGRKSWGEAAEVIAQRPWLIGERGPTDRTGRGRR